MKEKNAFSKRENVLKSEKRKLKKENASLSSLLHVLNNIVS